ncbi:hypothetical protein M4F23_003311 [Salmonella enterica]|nr:hypothetical protein [Salmonella enterica]EJE2972570.1 hypothetical protein [Salmonella enterica]
MDRTREHVDVAIIGLGAAIKRKDAHTGARCSEFFIRGGITLPVDVIANP